MALSIQSEVSFNKDGTTIELRVIKEGDSGWANESTAPPVLWNPQNSENIQLGKEFKGAISAFKIKTASDFHDIEVDDSICKDNST